MKTKNYDYYVDGTSALKHDFAAPEETPIINLESFQQTYDSRSVQPSFSSSEFSLLHGTKYSVVSSVKSVFSHKETISLREVLPIMSVSLGTFFLMLLGLALGL